MRGFCLSSLLLFLLLGGVLHGRPLAIEKKVDEGHDVENIIQKHMLNDEGSHDNDNNKEKDENADERSMIDTNNEENSSSLEKKKQDEKKADEKKDDEKNASSSFGGTLEEKREDSVDSNEKKEGDEKSAKKSVDDYQDRFYYGDSKDGIERNGKNEGKNEFNGQEEQGKDERKAENSIDGKQEEEESKSKKEAVSNDDKGSIVDEEMKKEDNQNKLFSSEDEEKADENKDENTDSIAGKEDENRFAAEENKTDKEENMKEEDDEKRKKKQKEKEDKEEKEKEEKEKKTQEEREREEKTKEEEKERKKNTKEKEEEEEKEEKEKKKEEEKKKEDENISMERESSNKSNIEKLKEEDTDDNDDANEAMEENKEDDKKAEKKKGKTEQKAFLKQILTYPAVRHGWGQSRHWGPPYIYNDDYPFFAYGYSWGCGHHAYGGHSKKSKVGKKSKESHSVKCRDYILIPTAFFVQPMHADSEPKQVTATSRQMISKDIACNDGDRDCAARQVICSMAGGSMFGDGMGMLGLGFPGVPGIHTRLSGCNMAGDFGGHIHGHGGYGGHGRHGGFSRHGRYGEHIYDGDVGGENPGCIDNCDGLNPDIGDYAAGLTSTGELGFSNFWSNRNKLPTESSFVLSQYGDNSIADRVGFGNFRPFSGTVKYNPGWFTKMALMGGNTEGGWNNGWGDFGSHKYGPGAGWGINFENERRSKAPPKGKER